MSSKAALVFESLSHVSLPCRDFEEAKRFFTEVLGATLLLDVGDFAEVDGAGNLPHNPSPRGHNAIVDLATLNYDRWGE